MGLMTDNHIAGEGNAYYTLFREYDPTLGRWWSADPMRAKYAGMSPYLAFGANPISFTDSSGLDLQVTTEKGKELFVLDDGKEEVTLITTKNLYKQKTQWFEPLADNYMPLKSVATDIENFSELKHFTWEDIFEFANIDRPMFSYQQGFLGDWKQHKVGGDGYYLVTVDGYPYWTDAIGQIPFAVDCFTDQLAKTGNTEQAIRNTIELGRKHDEGKLYGGKYGDANTYDIFLVLRGAVYGATCYSPVMEFISGYGLSFNKKDPRLLSNSISNYFFNKYLKNK